MLNIQKNEGGADRIIRFILAVVLFAVEGFFLSGIWSIIVLILAAVLFATSLTGFCGFYRLLGISTIKK